MKPSLKKILNPQSYFRFIQHRLREHRQLRRPNYRAVLTYPPGHYYSPLLDVESLKPGETSLPHDGVEYWEHADLSGEKQRGYFADLLERFPFLPFPKERTPDWRYYIENAWFLLPDAFTLSAIIRKEKPRRIIEVGSGFSSAVMLDTLNHTGATAALTFIEPFPERLNSLLSPADKLSAKILVKPVQEVPLEVFAQLEAQDILFIDSSHVAKIGSDVVFLLLRVLPSLKPGVLIHFHDIFYPSTYPADWLREGRAWNESLFLRAFLLRNLDFEFLAFNSFAAHSFPEIFQKQFPAFLTQPGSSLWLRKTG